LNKDTTMNKKKLIKTLLIVCIPILGFGVVTGVYNSTHAIVKKAPEFTLADTAGNNVSLNSFRGKYVLLDFWASWCRDCRVENKNLVKVYKKFKNQDDLVFLSVSLDFDKENWIKTIAIDGLAWPNHVSDLLKWKSPVAKAYGVRSIPQVFLIDKEGNIIAEGLTGSKLEEKLSSVFTSN